MINSENFSIDRPDQAQREDVRGTPAAHGPNMKRHSSEEISAMLQLAEDMVRDGRSQKEACRTLGISVMTYHRWRKQVLGTRDHQINNAPRGSEFTGSSATEQFNQIDALRLENERLRRIVSDLLLEKMKVQEALDRARK